MSDKMVDTASLADVQASSDDRNVKIDKVGVRNIDFPIIVQDRDKESQNTVAKVSMFVDLPHQFKGTHMSRFMEILNEHDGIIGVENISTVLDRMLERLEANTAFLNLSFPFFIHKDAPVTGSSGTMAYQCSFEVSKGKVDDFSISLRVPVTTLCPCSKEISVKGAHNQRGEVMIKVRFNDRIWIEELIEIAEDSASCSLFPVLKREDEKYVTEKAFDNPRFVEDLIREVALRLRKDSRIDSFRVEVENFESIHAHNAYAMIEEDKSSST
jgi:GTP cyclohydrolase I